MEEDNFIFQYKYLNKGATIVIVFLDGTTMIKGVFRALDDNIITVHNAIICFSPKKILRADSINIHLNAVHNLIYSVAV